MKAERPVCHEAGIPSPYCSNGQAGLRFPGIATPCILQGDFFCGHAMAGPVYRGFHINVFINDQRTVL